MPSLRDATCKTVDYLKVQNKIKEQDVTKIPVFLIKQKKTCIVLTQIRHKPDEIIRHHLGFAVQT